MKIKDLFATTILTATMLTLCSKSLNAQNQNITTKSDPYNNSKQFKSNKTDFYFSQSKDSLSKKKYPSIDDIKKTVIEFDMPEDIGFVLHKDENDPSRFVLIYNKDLKKKHIKKIDRMIDNILEDPNKLKKWIEQRSALIITIDRRRNRYKIDRPSKNILYETIDLFNQNKHGKDKYFTTALYNPKLLKAMLTASNSLKL